MNREVQSEFEDHKQLRKIVSLNDEPSSTDLFVGNGHNRTADSLAAAIADFSDEDSAIGLEGDWGSGKSTVLKLAAKNLRDKPNGEFNFHVFTMDLWTTHSDGFRKAFLETLISWSKNKGLIDSKVAEQELDYVRGKKKTTKFSNRREYNLTGLVFLALAPLLPIFYTWLSPFAFNPEIKSSLPFNIPFLVLFIVLFVYLLVISKTAYIYWKSDKKDKSFIKALSSSFSVFSKDIDTEVVTQDITEEDPSTIQFENAFRKILSKIQLESKNRIIIVLDNIDRLPCSDIPDVWSSIRSLLKRDEASDNYEDSFVTVIIPYDRKYVLRAFNSEPQDAQSKSLGFMSEDLIRKTFKRVFYVCPPVPTDWKVFFQLKLSEAIKYDFSTKIIYRLEKILEYHFQDLQVHPTPRQIINHINELAVLWQTWGHTIDIHSLSVFTCIRSKLADDPNLLKSQIISTRIENVLKDIDWRKDIACLIFNVDHDHAYQALLSQDLSRLLPSKQSDELINLSKIRGFNSVLIDLIMYEAATWSNEDPILISNVIENVIRLNLENHELEDIWPRLSSTLPYLIDLKNESTLCGHKGLIALSRQELTTSERVNVVKNLVGWANRNISNVDGDPLTLGKDWVGFFTAVTSALTSKERFLIIDELSLPAKPEIIIAISSIDPNLDMFRKSNLPIKEDELAESLKSKMVDEEAVLVKVLSPLRNLISSSLINELQQYYSNKLRKESKISSDALLCIAEILYFTYGFDAYEDRKTAISEIVADGTIFWHLKSYFDEEKVNLVCLSWFMLNELGPIQQNHFANRANHPTLGNLTSLFPHITNIQDAISYSEEQLEELTKIVIEQDDFSKWLVYADKASNTDSVFVAVLKRLLAGLSFKALNVNNTIKNYPLIRSLLDQNQVPSFLNKLSGWSPTIKTNFSDEKCLQIPVQLLEDVDSFNISSMSVITDVTDSYLKDVQPDDWETHLETASPTLELLIRRQKLSSSFSLLVSNFRTPVINHARKLLEGKSFNDTYESEWSFVLKSFRKNTLTSISKDMLNIFRDTVIDEAVATKFLTYYKDLIPHFPTDHSSESLLDRLLINLVATRDESIRQIFKDNGDSLKGIYKSLPNDAKKRFKEVIDEINDDVNDPDMQAWAKELLSIFR